MPCLSAGRKAKNLKLKEMQIYNSLTSKKEKMSIPKNRPVRLFVCGPTVYDISHIGHARTYIAFDIIARFLRFRGVPLVYLQNITNVDDKIITRARVEGRDPFALANMYEKEYKKAMQSIGINSVDIHARASEYIPEIITQIETLIRKGHAYEIENDGWYFNVNSFPRYGALSHRKSEDAENSISRIDESVKKKNKADFCLWKFVQNKKTAKPYMRIIANGEPAWATSLGWGRPGWHIEDTAISEAFFGPQYDLHGGGTDLKFPHHEAELAQQEAASGKKPFVKYWMHTGSLLVDGKKMSKSLHNYISISDFLGKEIQKNQNILRLIMCQTHYRSPINFTNELKVQGEQTLNTLSFFLDTLAFVSEKGKAGNINTKTAKIIKNLRKKFIAHMEDDFNTSEALADIFEMLNTLNPLLFSFTKKDAKIVGNTLQELLILLGITLSMTKIPALALQIAKKRELCRVHKQFIQGDALRKKLHGLGYEVSDTPLGPLIRKL